jgi:hypothetical protein
LGTDTPDPGKRTGLVTDVTVAKPNQGLDGRLIAGEVVKEAA